MGEKKADAPVSLPFAMQLADNPKVKGVLSGTEAMKKSGAQMEFIVANMLQAAAMKSAVILRAGDPPQYDKDRSPKSGLNLSKTSKQSFFKGALVEEVRFARLDNEGNPKQHDKKDAAHLALKPTDPDYQHVMQLDINMRDILREVGTEGELKILGFDEKTGLLRLEYKEGCGPKESDFNGQFVIDLYQGKEKTQFYSRDWNRPEHDPHWDPGKKIISKPTELSAIPDSVYEKVFNNTFLVAYTEEKTETPDPSSIKKAGVFANRPRSAEEFKEVMGEDHPYYERVKECSTLPEILTCLKQTCANEEEANKIILEVYDKGGSIVAGDWDGMALGHPPNLDPKFSEVLNVFAPNAQGIANKAKLINTTNEYLKQIQATVKEKLQTQGEKSLSAFDKKILSINDVTQIVSEFALARAGCITPHEFLFQQVLNDAYRDKKNEHYGEKYNHEALERAMERLLFIANDKDFDRIDRKDLEACVKKILISELKADESKMTDPVFNKLANHLIMNVSAAKECSSKKFDLPHFQHDVNVHDLYQHGFDMRNPYGSNLEGAWLLVTDDGGSVFYGETQEQLIEVLLTGDFLAKNHIDVSHGADLAAGWGRVIEKQLELGQKIPKQTLDKYETYLTALSPVNSMDSLNGLAPPNYTEIDHQLPKYTESIANAVTAVKNIEENLESPPIYSAEDQKQWKKLFADGRNATEEKTLEELPSSSFNMINAR